MYVPSVIFSYPNLCNLTMTTTAHVCVDAAWFKNRLLLNRVPDA